MREPRIHILHLYPEHMNLYGDRGNVLALTQRARWRGVPVQVLYRGVGEFVDWDNVDLVFMGGGEDTHQERIADDFLTMGPELNEKLLEGLPMLAICGGYQLLGRYYQTAEGNKLPGIGFLDIWTESGQGRAIGDVVIDTDLPITPTSVVGFENHGGRTFLGKEARALGHVRLGQGNNGEDGTEGAVQNHVIGTYLHGSLLPKNPHLADLLLSWSLMRGGSSEALQLLKTEEEMAAHQTIVARALNT